MTIRAVVLADLLFLCVGVTMTAAGPGVSPREVALQWAISARQEVYDRSMPPAHGEMLRHPICRVTSLRSGGGTDRFEVALTMIERCDETVDAVLLMPHKEPIAVQLARARIANPTTSIETAVPMIAIDRHVLPQHVAKDLLKRLGRVRISPLASDVIRTDTRRFEVTSIAWTSVTADFFDDDSPGSRELTKIIRSALAAAKLDEKDLSFDARRIEHD